MTATRPKIKFREGDTICTLWIEKDYRDPALPEDAQYVVGWCVEKKNNFIVHASNIVEEAPA